MYPYPTLQDVIAIVPEAAELIRSGKIVSASGAHAGWVVWGYGQSTLLPDVPESAELVFCPPEDAAASLESLRAAYLTAPDASAAVSVPWGTILRLLLPLLLDWLAKRGSGLEKLGD